jgi:rhodanese-related sulfurtransferase
MASDDAARRAAAAGYTNLYEMKDGIIGWVDAKQPTVPLSSYHASN